MVAAKFSSNIKTIRSYLTWFGLVFLCSWSTSAWAFEVPSSLSTSDAVFFTLAITSVAFFSIGLVVTRQFQWLTYSVYGVLAISLLASLDGTFAYLFDGNRWMMSDMPLLLGSLTASYGFFHCAYRLEPGHWLYNTRSVQIGFGMLMALLVPLYFAVPSLIPNLVPLYATLNTGMMLMFIAQIFPPVTWTQLTNTQHRITILWPLTTAAVAVGVYTLHFAGPGFEPDFLNFFNRLLFGMHLAHVLVFVWISVIEQIRAKVQAEHAATEAARKAAEAALALEVSEREFERAKTIAANRSRQLATASHDLKQPISALRQVVDQHASNQTESEVQRLRDAIDYLDQLASTYLKVGSVAMDDDFDQQEVAVDNQGHEQVKVNVVVQTVIALHQSAAKAKNIHLSHRSSSLSVVVHPLALTRALSNLVDNAINHSEGSRILMCARRRGSKVRIEVHDNGRGISSTELNKVTQARYRGAESSGSGLGLAIVHAQAEEQNWSFSLSSQEQHGTSAFLLIDESDHSLSMDKT